MRRARAWAVDWKEERVGDQRSWRERRGPTGTPRIEEEGEREEGGQEVGREGGEAYTIQLRSKMPTGFV